MTSAADGQLQFETAVPTGISAEGETAGQGVTCISCHQCLTDEYFDVNGQSVCDRCREAIVREAETPRGLQTLSRATLFGAIAAVLGAVLYYAVIAITNFEIGIVAIAIGYMVGYGVRRGARGRGGRRFQVLALVLTYWAVGLAYMPTLLKQMSANPPDAAAVAAQPAPAAPESSEAPSPTQMIMAVALLGVFSLGLPILVVLGSMPGGLISAAIIAFGMHQAWRMTGTPAMVVTGPYRISSPVAPAST